MLSSSSLIIGITGHRDSVLSAESYRHFDTIIKKIKVKAKGAKLLILIGHQIGLDSTIRTHLKNHYPSIKLLPEKISNEHVILSEEIATTCKYVIAFWDGHFNGKPFGTSDIVDRITNPNGETTCEQLYQIVTPRKEEDNASIPYGRRFGQKRISSLPGEQGNLISTRIQPLKETSTKKFRSKIFQPLLISFSLLILTEIICWGFVPEQNKSLQAHLHILLFGLIPYVFFQYLYEAKDIFNEFILPIAIALFTVLFGTLGFEAALNFNETGDNFFAAANLLTLNSSTFHGLDLTKGTNLYLESARISGLVFLIYAFLFALSKAMGLENWNRIKFWFYRKNILAFDDEMSAPFQVVIGNGALSMNLVINLQKRGEKVFFLSESLSPEQRTILKNHRVWFITGNTTTKINLRKSNFRKAREIFLVKEDDTENLRSLQELLLDPQIKEHKSELFVSIEDEQLAQNIDLINQSNNGLNKYVNVFDLNSQIVQKALFCFPIDRFNKLQNTAVVQIIGFNALAEKLLLQIMLLSHFPKEHSLKIVIQYTAVDLPRVKQFKHKYSGLFEEQIESIWDYTFPHRKQILFELRSTEDSIDQNWTLAPSDFLTVYICEDNGQRSVAIANQFLDILKEIKRGSDIRVLVQYDFPDREEEKHIQSLLRAKAYPIALETFGNKLQESESPTIKGMANLRMGKFANWVYQDIKKLSNSPTNSLEQKTNIDKIIKDAIHAYRHGHLNLTELSWQALGESYKRSNKLASAHASIKFRSPQETEVLSEMEHRRWCAEKLLEGYQFGARDNRPRKIHSNLVPFDQLSAESQMKDTSQVKLMMGLIATDFEYQ